MYRSIYFRKIAALAESLRCATGIGLHEGKDFSGNIVHVIMPGSSCLSSALSIPDDELVIGFNLSALLPIKYDYIFIENANDSEYSDLQYKACNFHTVRGTRALIKNLWMPDRFSISRLYSYSGFSELVLDIPLRPSFLVGASLARKWLVDERYAYSSFVSSTFFALSYLYSSGCKHVVIHGVDFGGPYFWELSSELCIKDYRVGNVKSNSTHKTERGSNPFSALIVQLVHELRGRGIRIEAANRLGALGQLL